MTRGLCSCIAGDYTSCYVPVEGQCSVKIQKLMFAAYANSDAFACCVCINVRQCYLI